MKKYFINAKKCQLQQRQKHCVGILNRIKVLGQGLRNLQWDNVFFSFRISNFCSNPLVLFKFAEQCREEVNFTKHNCRQQAWSSITSWPRAWIFTYAVKSLIQFPFLLLTIWTCLSQVSELIMVLCGLPGGEMLGPSSTFFSFPLRVLFYVA